MKLKLIGLCAAALLMGACSHYAKHHEGCAGGECGMKKEAKKECAGECDMNKKCADCEKAEASSSK